MKNIFKFGLVLVAAVVSLASCSDNDYEYTPAEQLSNSQVYFPSTNPTTYSQDMAEGTQTLNVTLSRAKTDDAITVNLNTTLPESAAGLVSVPSSVSFAAGESSVKIPVSYDPQAIGYDNPIKFNISLGDATYTTPYGNASQDVTLNLPAPWVSLGKGLYREDFITTFWGVENLEYAVEIQENKLVPGYYRLVNPYGAAYEYNAEGDWDASQDWYLEIHAEDPSKVYMSVQETGMDWGYGMISVGSLAGYYIDNGAAGKAEGYYGTLQDGIITFPTKTMLIGMADYNSGGLYYGNTNGMFRVVLPGYSVADNSIEITYNGVFTDTESAAYAVINAVLGADVTSAKAAVVEAEADPEAVADALASGDYEGTDITAGENKVAIGDLTGELQVVAVTIVNGEAKNIATANFEYYGGSDKNPWKSLGTGIFHEGIVSDLYGIDEEDIACEILENQDNPGYYRLVTPYKNWSYASANESTPLNLDINACNSSAVYIEPQYLGVNVDGNELGFASYIGYFIANGSVTVDDITTGQYAGYGGVVQNGVIYLPTFQSTSDTTSEDYYTFQGIVLYGSSSAYYGGNNITVTLPSAASAKAIAKAKANAKTRKSADFQRKAFTANLMKQHWTDHNLIKSSGDVFKK